MIRRASLLFSMLALALALALPALPRPADAAAGDPVLSYNIDVVSNYIFRGTDLYASVFDKDGKDHGAFQFSPALQPSLTFVGPGGLSFGLWGSYALTNREDDGAFTGLKALDEMDYTLSWAWSNRMGSFSTGLAAYTGPAPASRFANNEMFITWGLPFAASLSPTISHYVIVDASGSVPGGATYTSLGISGGEKITWNASLGLSTGIQDLTAGVGYGFGDMSVALKIAYRPDEELVGEAGNSSYPKTVAWLTFSYGREVTE